MKYTADFEERKGKGSFPAMITPAYQIAKRANELASDVSVQSKVSFGEKKNKFSHKFWIKMFSSRNPTSIVELY